MARELSRKILGPYRISHHPLCDEFHDHVYVIRGIKVCRGCVMQYSGMISALTVLIIGFLAGWTGLTEIQYGVILYLLIIPTFVTAFVLENRLFKDIARFLLGSSFTIALLLLVFTPDWLIKGWIVINFAPGYWYLNKRREKRNNEICRGCSDYSKIPDCPGYQILADRERIFTVRAYTGGVNDPYSLDPDQLE
ncbi:MAG: hypothetical protein ACTSP4_11820 [Candidatus Hodarchaeales archaeon]